ncbi:MAG: (d)CMP kinase [Clostridia bacterium]|nr:(d)CMP kinase [Clostridia bacterium]
MINVAIDGPSGAGKSSVARLAAKELGFVYIDTGALYRSVGVAALKKGYDTTDREKVVSMLPEIRLELGFIDGIQHVYLNGDDVSEDIRRPEASMAASNVSALPEVRAFLLDLQKNMAKTHDCILDGRDIGTVVLPDAQVKIFLTASAEERANRRYKELKEKGHEVDYDALLEEIKLRDYNDSHRAAAPLRQAEDAVLLDSSDIDLPQTVEKTIQIIREKVGNL